MRRPAFAEGFALPDRSDLTARLVGGSALFASRFRECAARALLLPRRHPGKRSPLWQQRQRSQHLLSVASRYPDFPIVLEAVREFTFTNPVAGAAMTVAQTPAQAAALKAAV